MSEMAKKARAAMKAKAKSITTDPHQKVDSSTWTPPEPLNTEAKTGMRPVSRRAYKKGGKVEGVNAKANMGKKPRASGGKTMANDWINRNAKEANEERPGVKHVGGMKKGGRAAHATDGAVSYNKQPKNPPLPPVRPKDLDSGPVDAKMLNKLTSQSYRDKLEGTEPQPSDLYDADQVKALERGTNKRGGRTGKIRGGELTGPQTSALAKYETKPKFQKALERNFRAGNYREQKAMQEAYPEGTQHPKYIDPIRGFKVDKYDFNIMNQARANQDKPNVRTTIDPTYKDWSGRIKDEMGAKKGGRIKRMDGGMMPPPAGMAQPMDPRLNIVKPKAMNFTNNPVVPGQKKGGKVEKHDDVKEDKALIRKMVKPSARTGKLGGGPLSDPAFMQGMTAMRAHAANRKNGGDAEKKEKKSEKSEKREKRATGGGIFSGPSYPGKIPGVTGGRIARATGGKTKGKTDINIIINGGGKGQDDMQGMPGMPRPIGPAGGMPLAPPPGPMQPPAGGPPMPPMPPMPAGGPPGMPPGMMPPGMPLPRKSGGRAYHSYKDMDAGAGSGEGRLEKTEIAKFKRGQRKAGGRTYRSYKDMDAGAASGLGRLEKTEIAAHQK